MILVAGGSGRLGTLVVNRLVERGLRVRVLSRELAPAARSTDDQIEWVTGDVRDPRCLGPALAGADTVVSAVQGFTGTGGNSPATVDCGGNANLIDAAKIAGADLVLLSIVGAGADSPMELFRMKHAAEQYAIASAIPTTIVRATAFLELWVELLQKTAARSGRPLVFGRGDNPINFVSVNDVAALVELAVTDATTRGTALEIGGPDDLTLNQLAQAVQDATGRAGTPRHVPRSALWLMANTIGRVKPALGRQARAALVMDSTDLTFDASPLHRAYPELATTTLADVLADRVAA